MPPTSRVNPSPVLRTPRSPRRERRRVEIRERLFRAALALFAERGYLETTVEDITNAADVGKGTFFNYFPTKEHVLATYGAERIAAIERALQEARAAKRPVLDVMGDLATDLAGQSKESPALLRSIYAAHASCEPVRAELQRRMEVGRQLMSKMYALAQKRGEVRRDMSAAELGRLTQIIFMGVTLSWSMKPDSSSRKTAAMVWEMISPNLRAQEKRISPKPRRAS
jgi:AcrR family transcriptional regulator